MTPTLTARRPVSAVPTARPARSVRPPVYAVTTARPARSAHRRSAPGPARLTRRGRLVLVAALVAVLVAVLAVASAWTAGSARAGDAGSAGVAPVAVTWVVQPGETMWQVAEAVVPTADPRETIARIVELNGLPDASVTVGQTLLVPATEAATRRR
ncbi:MAG: LysM peptidoglycan-binding domain-containing protein [Actinomycetota bacterium]|nr:LysM peptidoglycan-binding domain-containing protein [Actinomycetota bacterium]